MKKNRAYAYLRIGITYGRIIAKRIDANAKLNFRCWHDIIFVCITQAYCSLRFGRPLFLQMEFTYVIRNILMGNLKKHY